MSFRKRKRERGRKEGRREGRKTRQFIFMTTLDSKHRHAVEIFLYLKEEN
jgi:hypothetical protein